MRYKIEFTTDVDVIYIEHGINVVIILSVDFRTHAKNKAAIFLKRLPLSNADISPSTIQCNAFTALLKCQAIFFMESSCPATTLTI